jgi:N-alpha-acetyltransferase 30
MLAVDKKFRKRGIGSDLVKQALREMQRQKADLVVLETEITNKGALSLYANLGFLKDKRLHKYYMNGVDAFRNKLWLTPPTAEDLAEME